VSLATGKLVHSLQIMLQLSGILKHWV